MKPVNLYFYVRQNRHNILKTYIELKNMNFNNSKEESVIRSDTASIDITDLCSDNSDNDFYFDAFHWNSKHQSS